MLISIATLKPYYSPAEEQPTYKINELKDDTLRIAFIGDSWANFQEKYLAVLDSTIKSQLSCPVRVFANGAPGAKSKAVYYDMFSNMMHHNKELYRKNFQKILEQDIDYCIISAGINDTSTKTGSYSYAHNMILIINHLISSGITPVILEIPPYNIAKTYEQTSFPTKILRNISMLVNSDDIDCISKYREALKEQLNKYELWKHIIYIPYTEWSVQGYLDKRKLFTNDEVHLNRNGYLILDNIISEKIAQHYKSLFKK